PAISSGRCPSPTDPSALRFSGRRQRRYLTTRTFALAPGLRSPSAQRPARRTREWSGLSVSELDQGEDGRNVLEELPGFRAMRDDVRSLVVDAFQPVFFEFGSVIVREGEDADAFYVLVSGAARVVKQTERGEEIPLNTLRRGDSFGEMGLLGDSTRVATVRASGPVQALRLDRGVFLALTGR